MTRVTVTIHHYCGPCNY